MKAVIVNVFAAFLFISMSFKVHAEDQSQAVFPNLNPSDVQQQPVDQLSRLKRNSPGRAVRQSTFDKHFAEEIKKKKSTIEQKKEQRREQALAEQQRRLREIKEKFMPFPQTLTQPGRKEGARDEYDRNLQLEREQLMDEMKRKHIMAKRKELLKEQWKKARQVAREKPTKPASWLYSRGAIVRTPISATLRFVLTVVVLLFHLVVTT